MPGQAANWSCNPRQARSQPQHLRKPKWRALAIVRLITALMGKNSRPVRLWQVGLQNREWPQLDRVVRRMSRRRGCGGVPSSRPVPRRAEVHRLPFVQRDSMAPFSRQRAPSRSLAPAGCERSSGSEYLTGCSTLIARNSAVVPASTFHVKRYARCRAVS